MMLIMFIDFSNFQIMTLFAGYLGVEQQATHIILLNILTFCYQIPFGFQLASCALIGKEIGAYGRPKGETHPLEIIDRHDILIFISCLRLRQFCQR